MNEHENIRLAQEFLEKTGSGASGGKVAGYMIIISLIAS